MERKILTLITLLIMLFFLCAPTLIVYARISRSNENANVIRYTQLLLSRKGGYTGPIDGQCNTPTQQAIGKYKG
jgi:hypothetical protein